MAGTTMFLPAANPCVASALTTDYSQLTNPLIQASDALLRKWGRGLLALQVRQTGTPAQHGGIFCPACSVIHGRSGDAMFPFLLLAQKTKDQQYLDAALNVYEWMENNVSQPDGSWINEINVSNWK